MERLIFELSRLVALSELEELDAGSRFPSDSPHYQGAPATDAAIESAERRLEVTFPADYRAFLRQRDGWKGFRGEDDLLSLAELGGPAAAELKEVWREDPRVQRGLVVYAGTGRRFGFFDLATQPLRLVLYDVGETASFETFTAFLEDDRRTLEAWLLAEHGWRAPR